MDECLVKAIIFLYKIEFTIYLIKKSKKETMRIQELSNDAILVILSFVGVWICDLRLANFHQIMPIKFCMVIRAVRINVSYHLFNSIQRLRFPRQYKSRTFFKVAKHLFKQGPSENRRKRIVLETLMDLSTDIIVQYAKKSIQYVILRVAVENGKDVFAHRLIRECELTQKGIVNAIPMEIVNSLSLCCCEHGVHIDECSRFCTEARMQCGNGPSQCRYSKLMAYLIVVHSCH